MFASVGTSQDPLHGYLSERTTSRSRFGHTDRRSAKVSDK
jgi:hypothetical protein